MKILCIDDDELFLKLFSATIMKNAQPDDQLFIARNGDEGVEAARGNHMNVVITDLMMPGISGLEVLRRVKSIHPDTEVIVVTGQGSIESAVEAMKMGARDYLTKPFNADMLVEKLQTIRDLLTRSNEAENYRFAKEIIEENAKNSVADLEIKTGALLLLVENIENAISTEASVQEKINTIAHLIAESKKE